MEEFKDTEPRISTARIEDALMLCMLADALGAPIEGLDLSDPNNADLYGFNPAENIADGRLNGNVASNFYELDEPTDDSDQMIWSFYAWRDIFNGESSDLDRGETAVSRLVSEFMQWAEPEPKGIGGATLLAYEELLDFTKQGCQIENLEDLIYFNQVLEKTELRYRRDKTDQFNFSLAYLPTNSALPRAIGLGFSYGMANQETDSEKVIANLDQLDRHCEITTRITHGQDECIHASQLTASLIYLLMSGLEKDEALEIVQLRYDFQDIFEVLEQESVWGGSARVNLAVSLMAFIETDDPENAMYQAVNVSTAEWSQIKQWANDGSNPNGPDTDSYAILATAFSESHRIGREYYQKV